MFLILSLCRINMLPFSSLTSELEVIVSLVNAINPEFVKIEMNDTISRIKNQVPIVDAPTGS